MYIVCDRFTSVIPYFLFFKSVFKYSKVVFSTIVYQQETEFDFHAQKFFIGVAKYRHLDESLKSWIK